MYFLSQLSWTCCLVHKAPYLDRNRCWTAHKSQHISCYWTIIFIFLFSQLLPACFLLAVCFLPWEIKWRIVKTEVLWRLLSSKLSPFILLWNREKDEVNLAMSWILDLVLNFSRTEYQYIYTKVLSFRKLCLLLCLIELYNFCVYFINIKSVYEEFQVAQDIFSRV